MTTSSLLLAVGMVATRSSMSFPVGKRNLILPSCGLRFSAMSSRAIILMRETRALRYVGGMR